LPVEATERDVLSWFAPLTDRLWDLAKGYQPVSRTQRRSLVQMHQPLQGCTADRTLDIGFVDDPDAGVGSKCRQSQILIAGLLSVKMLAATRVTLNSSIEQATALCSY
jgi:hypothetical protein